MKLTEESELAAVRRANRRRAGNRRGVAGVAYGVGGYYLNPQQFGYMTAQEPVNGFGGGQMSTATSGEGSGGDGGGGGASAGGGAA